MRPNGVKGSRLFATVLIQIVVFANRRLRGIFPIGPGMRNQSESFAYI
jgi:hypothetical protein